MSYGNLPVDLGPVELNSKPEMMFYQYLPVKLQYMDWSVCEERLNTFGSVLFRAEQDFIKTYGYERYIDSYIYITAKHMYQTKECSYNRLGWHSDGFLTNDINYIWYDKNPTIFNYSRFSLSLDHKQSIIDMEQQALPGKDITYPCGNLLRLNQYNIHRVNPDYEGMRTFVKISFSFDKYNLEGNSHNYLLDYNWEMRPRDKERNHPQCLAGNN